MKRLPLKIVCILLLVSFACCFVQAQGTVYLSNSGAPSTGSYSVASNSWLAAGFRTGSNPGGYQLNSVTLMMLDATGNPNNFAVDLCDMGTRYFAVFPGFSLSTLSGSTDPQPAGLYGFDAPPDLVLLPNTYYFIMLSAVTAAADGAYQWSTTSVSPKDPGNDWQATVPLVTSEGLPGISYWDPLPGYLQFALNATAIPEPSVITFVLLGLGGLLIRPKKLRSK